MNIVNLFLEAAGQNPNKIALIHKGKEITYGELKEKVLKQVAYLQTKKIQAGDKVLVYIPMSIDLYIMLLAIFIMVRWRYLLMSGPIKNVLVNAVR